ncbi:TP901 family phage tail tape measure protein [Methylorubrum extorquens]
MSDINLEAAIRLSAEDRASAVIKNLQRDVDALRRSLTALGRIKLPSTASTTGTPSPASQALDFRAGAQALAAARLTAATDRQAARQREAETKAQERAQRKMQSDALRALRDRDRATAKALRDQLAAQRLLERETRRAAAAAERAHDADLRRQSAGIRYLAGLRARHDRDERRSAAQTERDREAALRRQISGDRWRFQLRDRMERQERRDRESAERDVVRHSRETWHRGRDAVHGTFRPAGLAALAGTAATVAGTRRVLGAESDVDAAEVNTRAYGGLSFDAARELREKWAAPTAEALGADTLKLLNAWTDATKLGVPASGAKSFAELSTKTSEAWSVPFEAVTDALGAVNTILTSQGASFSIDRLSSVANTVQHLAAKQSTTPEKLVSFLQRGAGAAQLLGMSQEAGIAFGSASTSLGNRAGESGTLFDYVASRVVEMPKLVKQRGQEGADAKNLMKVLGYGSADAMDQKRRANPDTFLPDLFERFSKISDPRKQDQAIRFFTGREWIGEASRIIKVMDTYREAVKLAKEAKGFDAVGEVWKLHQLKLGFVFKQFRAGWLNILGEFGKVLSPMARQAGDYFLGWSSKLRGGGLQARFKAVLDGLLEGLGFKDLPDALKRIFGEPGQGSAGSIEAWRATAREFAAGLRDVFGGIGDFLRSFSGGSPEIIARWTGRILALSAALLVLSPVIATLSGLASGVLALGAAATTALAAFKLAGLAGAGGAAAGAAGAAAGAGGLAAILGAAVLPVSLVAVSAGVVAAIWGRQALKGAFLGVPSGNGAEPETPEGKLGAELGAIAPRRRREADPPARVEKQSYNGAHDSRPTVNRAAYQENDRPLTTPAEPMLKRFVQPPANENDLGAHNGAFDRRYIRPAALDAGDDAMRQLLRRVATVTLPSAGSALDGIVRSSSGGVPGFQSSSPAGGVPTLPSGHGAAPTVPSWYGRGNGTQGGGINPPNAAGPRGPLGDRMKSVYTAFRSAGLGHESSKSFAAEIGRENDFNPDLMYGSHLDPHNRKRNAGMMSWQGDRATKLLEHLRERGQLNADGTIKRTQGALNAQAEFAVGEMRSGALGARGKRALGTLNDPNATHQQRALTIGDDVIRWRQHDPRYAHHARKRDQYYSQLGGLTEGATGLGSEKGQYDGLRIKGQQAVAGGGAHQGTTDLAREAQRDLPGGVKHFAAFNDRHHQGTRSKHATGLAFDTTLEDASQSAAAARAMRAKLREAGLAEHEFTVIDEYKNPSARSTGGHIHSQFNSPEAAKRYHEHVERKRQAERTLAGLGTDPKGRGMQPEASESAEPFKSSGWKRDGWTQTNGGPWKNDRTGELADEARTRRLDEGHARGRERFRKWMGGVKRDADGNQIDTGADIIRPGQGFGPKPAPIAPTSPKAQEAVEGFKSSGWKPAAAGNGQAAPAGMAAKPTVDNLLSKMPAPPKAMPGQDAPGGKGRSYDDGMTQAGRSGAGATITVTNYITAGNQSPQEMAAQIQRHVQEAWNYRSHDLEPELT